MKNFFILVCLFCTINSFADICPKDRKDYFCIEPNDIRNSEINIANFYQMPFEIQALYSKEIQELNYPVAIKADWNSPYFGAGVSLYENSFNLMILGGMARMKEMTADAYTAIVCHEFGHILGGDPKQTISGADWASAEGQADHFSASQCLDKYFRSKGMTDSNLILKRIEKAGFDFMTLAASAESDPKRKFFKRGYVQMSAVKETILNLYPSTQCRYETYRNPKIRPSCWFKE